MLLPTCNACREQEQNVTPGPRGRAFISRNLEKWLFFPKYQMLQHEEEAEVDVSLYVDELGCILMWK